MWPVLVCEGTNPSSFQLFDIFGSLVSSLAHWDGEMGKSSVVLLVSLGDRIEYLLIRTDPFLQVLDTLLVAAPLLYVIGFALLQGDGKPARDSSECVGVDVVVGMAIEDGES
jgi:hypothetical protein